MLDFDDKNYVAAALINDSVRKTPRPATPGSRREGWPRVGKRNDVGNGSLDFRNEFFAQAFFLLIIIISCVRQLEAGRRIEFDLHRWRPLIWAKTCSAGIV